ncbi:hypothetical protein EZV62_025175 [Acer yangbiense]|uniref:Uncharacterized protein n=1 Tax=Acer yangbiense TaxID=1000413 RepID=A0A5C7GX62_9ROSI|nr:hypothetical protein EZV62_025175 [Acer yangbiense]
MYQDDDGNNNNNNSFVTTRTEWTRLEDKLFEEALVMLFLIGLKKFGKGDWRSISRNVVVTRTPTQVASHAQKYFLRQNSQKKERKRSSIHDITTVDSNSPALPVDQNWIPPPGGPVQLQPLPTTDQQQQQQPSALQQFLPPSQFPGHHHGGSEEYPNYGYPM